MWLEGIGREASPTKRTVETRSRTLETGRGRRPRDCTNIATTTVLTATGCEVSTSGMAAHEVLPAVHRVFSLVKRWLMGTMQGSVSPEHVQAYFDEWVFRFNRRNASSRGLPFDTLLLNAVQGQPVTYESLCKTGRTRPATTARRITATIPQPRRGTHRATMAYLRSRAGTP